MAEFRPTPTLLKRTLYRGKYFRLWSYIRIPRTSFSDKGAYEIDGDKVIVSLDLYPPRSIKFADWKSTRFAMDDMAFFAFQTKLKEILQWYMPDTGLFVYKGDTHELTLDEETITQKYGNISSCGVTMNSLYGSNERTLTIKPAVISDPDNNLTMTYTMGALISLEDPLTAIMATQYEICGLSVAIKKFSYATEPLILTSLYDLAVKAGNVSRGFGMTQQSIIDNSLNGSLTDARIANGVIKTNISHK